ncbi:hypothetical protein CSTERLE_13810 [Thermoclostridium stercorarium subsp. leptospartum DSM 9219]|uniref:Uncharacterized protein n=1 Tax=Thermoclostridium stercorarium subsp. leptospartum DSM 9219 TaxID=1346611 RepID=A0A1B1YP59_THEST|nr:hypothetical protein [Thermoclostridium stercorarium]ANX02559.1 hypothetical protein CSTERLE_13810 [Thermoclostridium stercorarium subsp. leptospartum DSM 9219]
MLKKLTFVFLVVSFMIAGALVSMADEDEDFIFYRYTVNNAIYAAEESQGRPEEYSHEAVIEMYSSLFFDADSKSDVEFIKDINITEKNDTKDNNKDYSFSAVLSENVLPEEGNAIILMFFIRQDDTYEELIPPEEIDPSQCRMKMIEPITLELPNVGEDNPNHIRIIVFLKNSYKELTLDNIQIYDAKIVINQFNFWNTLIKKWSDAVNQLNSDIFSK